MKEHQHRLAPKYLVAVQQHCSKQIDRNGKRYSRNYCNTLVNNIRSMFRWAVVQELVAPVTADALKYVPALRQGRTAAPETEPRLDVPDTVVNATLLTPYLAGKQQLRK
ncbi:MAG: hypothetical protein LBT46_12065 [Planctomycetaceae bacterium]|nr:hypothetical protein [Planctomycetaceae bacterium]